MNNTLTTREKLVLNLLIDYGCGLKVNEITPEIGGHHALNLEAIESLEKKNLVCRDDWYDYCAVESANITILGAESYSIYFTGYENSENFETAKELRKIAIETEQEGNGFRMSMSKDGEKFYLTDKELSRHINN